MKTRRYKSRTIGLAIGVILLAVGVTLQIMAANETFSQASWVGGTDGGATAVHPTNQSNWTQYFSKDSNISAAGDVTISSGSDALSEDTDTDFDNGTLTRTVVSGSGTSAVVTLESTLDDPFVTAPQQWTTGAYPNGPSMEAPNIQRYHSKVLKVGSKIYANFTYNYFGEYNATAADGDETWTFLKRSPKAWGAGADLAYAPGDTDTIYAFAGGGTKTFMKYTISTNTWALLNDAPYYIDAAACLVGTDHGTSGRIYAAYGSMSQGGAKFGYYDINTGNWQSDLASCPESTYSYQYIAKLIYPGSGDDIFWLVGSGNNMYKYTISPTPGWSSDLGSSSVSREWNYGGGGCYLDGYIYTWSGYTYEGFWRYNVGTPGWEDLTGGDAYSPRRMDFRVEGPTMLYDPGSGDYYRFFMPYRNYMRTIKLHKTTLNWQLGLRRPPRWNAYGATAIYAPSDGNIYYADSRNNPGVFYKYTISTDTWEQVNSCPSTWGQTRWGGSSQNMAYYDGKIYFLTYYDATYYGFGYYDTSSGTWTDMQSDAPPSLGMTDPAALTYVNYSGGNYLYYLQGYTNLYRLDLDGAPLTWEDITSLPEEVREGCGIAYPGTGNYLYVSQGYRTCKFWGYKMNNDTWEVLADKPGDAQGSGEITFAVPGDTDGIYNTLPYYDWDDSMVGFRRYDISENKWYWLEPPPSNINNYGCVAATSSTVYFWSPNFGCSEKYDVATDTWAGGGHKFDHPRALTFGSGELVGDTIYFFATGYYPSSTVFTYNTTTMDWTGTFRTPFQMGCGSFATRLPGTNKIYLTQGGGDHFWEYDTDTGVFTQKENTPYGCFTAYSTLEGYNSTTIYAFLGNENGGTGTKIFKYTVGSGWDSGVATPSSYYSPSGHPLLAMPSKGGLYWVTSNRYYWYFFTHNPSGDGTWSTITGTALLPYYAGTYSTLYYPGSGNYIYYFNRGLLYKFDHTNNTWEKLSRATYMDYWRTTVFGTGDILYVIACAQPAAYWRGARMFKYHIPTNRWDFILERIRSNDVGRFFLVPDHELQRVIYPYDYRNFYRFEHGSDEYYPELINLPDLSDSYCGGAPVAMVPYKYPDISTDMYLAYGNNSTTFRRYNMRTDVWTTTLDSIPEALAYYGGACGVATNDAVYLTKGGASSKIWKYVIPDGPWSTYGYLAAGTIERGSGMCYPGRGDEVYILRGGRATTTGFSKMNISGGSPSFATLANPPFITGGIEQNAGSARAKLFYPGSGDYIYAYPVNAYYWYNDDTRFYRYSISGNSWEELESSPFELGYGPQMITLPGYEDYIIAASCHTFYESLEKPSAYYLWKSGTYTSDAIYMGEHSGYGTMTWSDNSASTYSWGTKGSTFHIEMKVRTADNANMTDATAWSSASYVMPSQDISSLSSVSDSHTYLQYRIYLYAEDMASLPEVDSVSINYGTYPTDPQTITSSKYNTTETRNRIMKLSWTEDLPTDADTEIRAQLRTSPNGSSWSDWMGPSGTTVLTNDFDVEADYAKNSNIGINTTYAELLQDLEDFQYKQTITVDNTGLGTVTNFDVTIDIGPNNPMWSTIRSDGADMRFYDGSTKFSYRLIKFDYTTKTAKITIRIPSLSADQVKTVYMLYGSSTASSESDSTTIPPFPTNGLVSWWKFDEGSGTTATDSIGSNNGDIQGDIDWVDGHFGGALEYPGAGTAGVKINDHSSLRPSTEVTISAWIRAYTWMSGTKVVFAREWGTSSANSYVIYRDTTNRLRYFVYNSSNIYDETFMQDPGWSGAGEWMHVAAVKSGTTVKLYKNGNLVQSGSAPSSISYSGGKPVFIGADCNDNTDDPKTPWWGMIDEVTFYNRGLNDAEVEALYLRDGAPYAGKIYINIPEESQTSPTLGAGWPYREAITLTNSTGSTLTDYIVAIELDRGHDDFWSHVQDDGDDIRFIDSDNTTELTYNLCNFAYSDSKEAFILVKVTIPAGSKTIYMYYGEGTTSTTSDSTIGGTLDSTEQLVGHWKFDEGEGTTTADSSDTGVTATLVNTPGWVTGIFGGALSFNGSNTYVNIPYNYATHPRREVTYAAWAYRSDWSSYTSPSMILSCTERGGWRISVNHVTGGRESAIYNEITRRTYEGTYYYTVPQSARSVLSEGWHHFAGTNDGRYGKLYIDGELMDTKDWGDTYLLYYYYSNSIIVGAEAYRYAAPTGSYYFNGYIDDVVLYSRALTDAEIMSLARGGGDASIATFDGAESANTYTIAGTYYTDNPVIQPIYGAFYDDDLYSFAEVSTVTGSDAIKYQVSNNGYEWYYYDSSNWVTATGGYTGGQVNTAAEINTNLATFMSTVDTTGEFYYRAYLHSDDGTTTPQLDRVDITLASGVDYYLLSTGATAVNQLHTDAVDDQYVQYKATLYTDGEATPTLEQVDLEYIKAYITLVSPVGGEVWGIGEQKYIAWDAEGLDDAGGGVFDETIKIEYSNDGGTSWQVPDDVNAATAPNTGSFEWTVDDDHTPDALIRLTANGWTVINDQSSATFRIVGSVTLTNPTGGERWLTETDQTISWTSSATMPEVKLEYSRDSGTSWSPVLEDEGSTSDDGIVSNDGDFTWNVPDEVTATDSCLVRVSDKVDPDTVSTLDTPFRIIGAISTSFPTLNYPIIASDEYDVTWTSTGTMDEVDLSYSLDGGTVWRDMAGVLSQVTTITNIDTYPWTVPDMLSETCVLKVEYHDDHSVADTTPNFYIRGLQISSPNGVEEWELDSTHDINWSSGGSITPPIRFWLSSDGGSTYPKLITTRPTNNPPYNWYVASSTYSTSDTCKVKIIDDEGRMDVSDAVFRIMPNPAIAVTAPVDTDEWIVGTDSHDITWTTVGNVSSDLAIEYSVDGGGWTAVSPAPTAEQITAQSYSWTAVDAISSNVIMRVQETSIPTNTDGSARDTQTYTSGESAPFSIISPTVTITAPTSGTIWVVGDTSRDITWTHVGTLIDDLILEYSTDYDGGDPLAATWNNIDTFDQATHSATYSWTNIPAPAAGSSVYLRITDSRSPTVVTDISEAIEILAHQRITLIAPVADEIVIQGDFYDVTWDWDGQATTSDLAIKYSTDGGSTYPTLLDSSLTNIPTEYSWYVPSDVETTTARLWIYDSEDGLVESFSDVFTISIPRLNVTSPVASSDWYATGTYDITWEPIGAVSASLKIEYSVDGGSNWGTVTAETTSEEATTQTKSWQVADNAGSSCLIKITDNTDSRVTKTSEAFDIIAPTVTIVTPDGSEIGASAWVVGTTHAISWTTTGGSIGAIAELKIRYTTNGSDYSTITTITDSETLESDAGSYDWDTPDDVSDSVQVKIYDTNRIATEAISSVFEIAPPSVNITAPNGGENWIIGTEHAITWYTVGDVVAPLTIYYAADGVDYSEVSSMEDDDGTYDWTVPDDYAPGTAKVKIEDSHSPTAYLDTSDAAFTIGLPTITVDTPAEIWTATDTKQITWSSVGTLLGPLKVEWSTDNFMTTPPENVITDTLGAGNEDQSWTVPVEAISTNVRTRVTDLGRPLVFDKSDEFVVLPVPVITISSPNESDVGAGGWRIGQEYSIEWSDNGGAISNDLLLQYAMDGGTEWHDIETGVANNGGYTWSVPLSAEASTDCVVRIYDNVPWKTSTNLESLSDTFEIAIPSISIQKPEGGEYWAVGDTAPIEWITSGYITENGITIQYSLDGGTSYYSMVSGEPDDGVYSWTIPDVASTNSVVKILDSAGIYGDEQVQKVSEVFNLIPDPILTIAVPNGGETYVLGETVVIDWSTKGLQVEDVKIEYSSDNFTSDTRTIIASTPNTGDYTWVIPEDSLSGATIKVRISMVGRPEIVDTSDENFRIRGGFEISSPSVAGERRIVNRPETVTWTTRGTIGYVTIKYSSDGGTTWEVVDDSDTTPIENLDTYDVVIPEPQTTQAIIRIEDSTDESAYADTVLFEADYYTITWRIVDYDTAGPLKQLAVADSHWEDQTMTIEPPIDHDYPYGEYTTFWSKDGYIERATEWISSADKQVTVPLENQLTAMVEWHVLMSTSYSAATDTLNASAWLERRGKLIGVVETDLADLQYGTLEIYDGDTLLKTVTDNTHDNQGAFSFSWASTGLESGKTYFVKAIISYRDSVYTSGSSVNVTQAKAAQETRAMIADEAIKTTAIKAAVETDLPEKITTAKVQIKADTAKILTDTRTTLPARVAAVTSKVETGMKSAILNTQNSLRKGEDLKIRYRTHSGLSTVMLNIYSPKNKLKKTNIEMTEIGETGIYEREVTFEEAWGEGHFTIICSEDTCGTMDALTLTIFQSDVDSIAGNVAAIMGTTSGISDIGDVADTLTSQFSVIEKSLASVGKGLVDDVQGAVEIATEMESVFMELSKVSKAIKSMETTTKDMNLDKFYNLETEKKQDMRYLKNKTNELRAMMDVNQKMIDNVANEPVVQTWFEYRSVVLRALIINPSESQKKVVPFRAYLPKEARPEHLLSRGDLKVSYDTQQGSYYVHANITLAPKETKEIEIEMKDIWQIKPAEIESLRIEATKVHNMLQGTEFSDRAKFLLMSIEENLNSVAERQKIKPVNPEDHISKFRENLNLMQEAKADLTLARSLLSQTKPFSLQATWKLILSIIIFLGILSLGFYVVWQKQIKLGELPTIEGEEEKAVEKPENKTASKPEIKPEVKQPENKTETKPPPKEKK